MDMASILRLLDFLEALFNGGSDFNEPLKRCLNRLTDAKWANSDILLVSGTRPSSLLGGKERGLRCSVQGGCVYSTDERCSLLPIYSLPQHREPGSLCSALMVQRRHCQLECACQLAHLSDSYPSSAKCHQSCCWGWLLWCYLCPCRW